MEAGAGACAVRRDRQRRRRSRLRGLEIPPSQTVALVHDYRTQRGGAERVALALTRAFPGAPLHTSLYEPGETFPGFAAVDVRALPLNRLGPLRRSHRLALPLLAPAFSRLRIDTDVTVCSTSGWAHGARVSGRKVAYCYTPARWLYQPTHYFPRRGLQSAVGAALLRQIVEETLAGGVG